MIRRILGTGILLAGLAVGLDFLIVTDREAIEQILEQGCRHFNGLQFEEIRALMADRVALSGRTGRTREGEEVAAETVVEVGRGIATRLAPATLVLVDLQSEPAGDTAQVTWRASLTCRIPELDGQEGKIPAIGHLEMRRSPDGWVLTRLHLEAYGRAALRP